MSFRVLFTDEAIRDLKGLPRKIRRQIDTHILKLENDAHPHGCKALKGDHRGFFRIRSGNYRIIYEVHGAQLVVVVIRIGHRKDIYD